MCTRRSSSAPGTRLTWKKLASYRAKKKDLCKKFGVKEGGEGLLKGGVFLETCGTYSTLQGA